MRRPLGIVESATPLQPNKEQRRGACGGCDILADIRRCKNRACFAARKRLRRIPGSSGCSFPYAAHGREITFHDHLAEGGLALGAHPPRGAFADLDGFRIFAGLDAAIEGRPDSAGYVRHRKTGRPRVHP